MIMTDIPKYELSVGHFTLVEYEDQYYNIKCSLVPVELSYLVLGASKRDKRMI